MIVKLIHSGSKAAIAALSGFILPFLLDFSSSYWLFELSLIVSLFIGGTLTATSIGITVSVYLTLINNNSIEGQAVLGAAVIDDLLGGFVAGIALSRRFLLSMGAFIKADAKFTVDVH